MYPALLFYPYIAIISFPFFLSFQSSWTLELALHLESKVIALKQDALRLMNVALAGTACGQLLSIMEFAFGYPESQESKDQAQQLEELCMYPALLFYPYIAIISFPFFLSFQSSRTLELALHLELKVIALKQDAL